MNCKNVMPIICVLQNTVMIVVFVLEVILAKGDFEFGAGSGEGTWMTPSGDFIHGHFRQQFTSA
jgi:hypothetical protein